MLFVSLWLFGTTFASWSYFLLWAHFSRYPFDTQSTHNGLHFLLNPDPCNCLPFLQQKDTLSLCCSLTEPGVHFFSYLLSASLTLTWLGHLISLLPPGLISLAPETHSLAVITKEVCACEDHFAN